MGAHVAKMAPSRGTSAAGASKLKDRRDSLSEFSVLASASWGSSASLVFGGVRGKREPSSSSMAAVLGRAWCGVGRVFRGSVR